MVARKLHKPAIIHLEMETGMNRTGLDKREIDTAIHLLQQNRSFIILKGLCTHFAGAESIENHDRVKGQLHNFKALVASINALGTVAKTQHSACSAAMMVYPESHMDMVRIGIMQYGFWPSPETKELYLAGVTTQTDPLQRIISWKSRIMSLKQVPAGDYIGYGTTFKSESDMVLAIIPVGYAWGYSRSLSNQGQVLVHDVHCPVVGIVNMNILMVDVSLVNNVEAGNEVVLLGTQGKESISVASFGELSTQLNYELLTRLPLQIPRFVVD